MIFKDRLFKEINITEPVILELINDYSLQRLKGIDQAGYIEPYFPNTKHYRFEHSLSVYFLLNKHKASLEEQIAGLIHDVSHSVFSHCIDYVLDSGSEKEHSYQDNIFKDFVKNTNIPKILKKYNIDPEYILNDDNFPLKENNIPNLCADRIDYSLRTGIVFNEISPEEANNILNNLKTENNNWIFKNLEIAKKHAQLFLDLNKKYYAGFPSAVMFKTTSDCLKYALQKQYININDLYTTDDEVLNKIKNNLKDEKLNNLFLRMNNKFYSENNPNDYDAIIFCKSRIIDPLIETKKGIKKLSQIENSWKKVINEELKPKKYFIKLN